MATSIPPFTTDLSVARPRADSSIQAEQRGVEGDPHEPLHGADAVAKLRELAEGAQSCFFCTQFATSETGGARPMSVREVTDDGAFWFLSAIDSHKNRELAQDPAVRLYLQGSSHAGFVFVEGRATISRDLDRIRRLWNPLIRTWFTEGAEDPRITVIRVDPTHAYYWDTRHGGVVATVKMLIGAAIGKTMDDSVEGPLTV
jgi:general stress protein 26